MYYSFKTTILAEILHYFYWKIAKIPQR